MFTQQSVHSITKQASASLRALFVASMLASPAAFAGTDDAESAAGTKSETCRQTSVSCSKAASRCGSTRRSVVCCGATGNSATQLKDRVQIQQIHMRSNSGGMSSDSVIEVINTDDDALLNAGVSESPKKRSSKRFVVISPRKTEQGVDRFEIEAFDDQPALSIQSEGDDASLDRELTVDCAGKESRRCHIKVQCDTTKTGKSFSIHLDGLNRDLGTMQETMKGMDKALKGLDKMLKRLSIRLSTADSALKIDINGIERSNGAEADVRVFVPNDIDEMEDINLDNLRVQTEVENLDDDQAEIQQRVYILRFKDGDVQHNATMRTERSVDQELKLEDLSLRPNPSNDGHVQLSIKAEDHSPITLSVDSEDGRHILSENIGSFSGAFTKQLDLSAYGSGVYFVRVLQNGKSATLKVIIEK